MHWDHYGAVIELLADQDISADRILWQTNYDWDLIKKTEARAYTAYQIHMRKLRNNAKARNIPLVELKNSDVLDFGSGAKGKIIYGCDRNITANYINNQSLVFRFTYGTTSILFTGDMGFEEEAAILATGAVVKSDIYKAAHHSGGGSNSENFVRAVAPDFAIAPQPEFLYSMKPGIESGKRITNCGVKIFYAHEFRNLCLRTDGKKFTVWEGNRQLTVKDITK
jgi:beta-lactamase superfamily II metal-dependent hydrolase